MLHATYTKNIYFIKKVKLVFDMYIIENGEAIPDSKTAKVLDGSPLMNAINAGTVFMADTIKALAKKINVPAEALRKTIETYNAYADAQKDQDGLGRGLYEGKFTKGPRYASPRVSSTHHTMGGVRVDTQYRVLTGTGKIIHGLLAAGEVSV